MRERFKIYPKMQGFFLTSLVFFEIGKGAFIRKGVNGGVLMCQGQNGKFPA